MRATGKANTGAAPRLSGSLRGFSGGAETVSAREEAGGESLAESN
jgi:hypothetical protein